MTALAVCAAAAGTLTACARDDGYRGGVYASFTLQPAAATPPANRDARSNVIRTASTGRPPRAQLNAWIANDEAALRRTPRAARLVYGTHVASLLNELWLAHRDDELARRLATVAQMLPDASDDAADARFFAGDRLAGFDAAARRHAELRAVRASAQSWIAAVERLRSIREPAPPDGRSIDAALVEGDLYAGCGAYRDARITWYRAFSTAVLQPPDRYRFFPAWTSAMRRLVRFRSTRDTRVANPGCSLPAPVVDPLT